MMYSVITKETIEDNVYSILEKKMAMAKAVTHHTIENPYKDLFLFIDFDLTKLPSGRFTEFAGNNMDFKTFYLKFYGR